MPTRAIRLSEEQDAFVEQMVRSGVHPDADAVVRDALQALRQRHDAEARKLDALRQHLQAGLNDLERGDYDETEDAGLKQYLAALAPSGDAA